LAAAARDFVIAATAGGPMDASGIRNCAGALISSHPERQYSPKMWQAGYMLQKS
jgi:hypothetical protein